MYYQRIRLFPFDDSGCGISVDRNRIPGMIVTSKGTLIVYNEARTAQSDWSLMVSYAIRSTDGGKTFSAPIVLATGNEELRVAGNPVMVEDKKGVIHFFNHEEYTLKGGRLLHRISLDDGVTWSEPEDITSVINKDEIGVFAVGPGHGLLTPSGAMVCPVWYVPKKEGLPIESHGPSVVNTLYSLDDGKTWKLGEALPPQELAPSPNEAEVALTSDGKVIMNARVVYQHRALAYSDNGYSGWSDLEPRADLPDSICFGSIIACTYNGKHVLVTANCICQSDNKTAYVKRDDLCVRVSFDDGKTWSAGKIINSDVPYDYECGGYIELAYDKTRDKIYILHEVDLGKSDYLITCDVEYLLS